ncbi:hypothetical protein [Nocardioides sp.]|uniref:rolling circle replication-associated protein n=1 Tax=Nocardioides sp. TaxID=35761 RepID=UPI0025D08B01|nr:hypothetical protein [Nocardioides sp.]
MSAHKASAGSRDASLLPVRAPDAGWYLTLYPDAAEGGGCFVSSRRKAGGGVPGSAVDPERSRAEAARRAGVKVRRYCAANGLDRLGTLTYAGAGCHDPGQVRADVGVFFRRLRSSLGGAAFPYVWVPEWHPGGHGLHLHYAMGRYVPRGKIDEAWGHGYVHIKRLSDVPPGAGGLRQGRSTARYLSKYVTKAFSSVDRASGLHRYEVGQGFQPRGLRLHGRSGHEALAKAVAVMGGAPAAEWWSRDAPAWEGPPAYWFSWDHARAVAS